VRFSGLQVSDYAVSIDATAIPVYSIPDIEALVDGHLDIGASHLEGAVQPIPDIEGSLVIQQAEITREFTASSAQGAGLLESTDRPEFLADVSIEAPGRVWVRNSNADAELFGNVQIIRTPAGLDVEGRAATKRGHYSAYLEKFEITRGDLDFSRHRGWEPEMDIEAQRGRVNERIYVHLTGKPSEPRLVFSSDAGGSADELQQILMADIRNDPANVATTVVENVVSDLGYLDSITIDPAESRTPVADGQQTPLISAYNVSAGWAVSDRVFVTYTRGINQSDLNQRVALELDLLRGLLLASSWEIRYIPSPEFLSDSAQNVFNVDVKFRHEY
jgi:autotransporter translocation and assembly factor TamB